MELNSQPLIAILDDEVNVRKILTEDFQRQGWLVFSGSDKAEFLESLGRINPDVIISDVYSHPLNGVDFLEIIKSNPRYRSIPVIFFTGLWSARLNLYLKGAYAVLTKPNGTEKIMSCVSQALNHFCTS